jgi:YT521-B-like domain
MQLCGTSSCCEDRFLDLTRLIIRASRNTQERKPVTNSRDTQELLPEAGQEMLRIFHAHPARTSLLQDFGFYEVSSCVGGAVSYLMPFGSFSHYKNRCRVGLKCDHHRKLRVLFYNHEAPSHSISSIPML